MRRTVALLLTLAAPGAGHLALGRRRRAWAWIAGFQALILMWVVLFMALPLGAVVGMLVVATAWLAVLSDVLVVAPSPAPPRWPVVVVVAVTLVVAAQLERTALRTYVMRAFTIPASSMTPTLEPGDYFIADKTAYRRGDPRRGDIIVFEYPPDPRRTFVKRVIALPGERVILRGREVLVDGVPIAEPYVAPAGPARPDCRYAYGCTETLVPSQAYFVMGDNRDNAQDSRYWGFVPRKAVIGRAALIYWSREPVGGSLRLERIATRLGPS